MPVRRAAVIAALARRLTRKGGFTFPNPHPLPSRGHGIDAPGGGVEGGAAPAPAHPERRPLRPSQMPATASGGARTEEAAAAAPRVLLDGDEAGGAAARLAASERGSWRFRHRRRRSPRPSQMPATASGGARPEEAAAAATVASWMGTRPEELTARLAASGPATPSTGRGGSGAVSADGDEAEHERVQALREIKNQIIGPGRRGGGRGGAGGARQGGGRGEDDGTRAVLAAAVVGHLIQVLAHHDEKVLGAWGLCWEVWMDGWRGRGCTEAEAQRAAAHRPQGSAHRAEMVSAGDGGGTARSDLICVTGGNGFIGSWPVRFLLDRGYTVHTTVKNLDDEDFYEALAGLTSSTLLLAGRRSKAPAASSGD
ncbi:translation initiation factor IF-2-like isoform X1 [Panicum virgatum]|uniref:translation initiation factor IF-2-like isoform X1 n=1 Tax=Panicum virgatum TaxID=38727 RepID=UPI0019D653D7|nr:translation initiation factor IF-2-like isoform X1 [Panicum virgatum]XP_039837443.1 translation initiation factor IF-2-like isoform X1 [Panicum virgatum]XP_039837444.1 translation initiation factor IF-2-like isoform X1 [Panicum virgatum]XP_039837445.1 translation initiation factor IF-2-like isoform X1 [Panicum virgatum]XP_039837446.1 translation initiation factor IF-2-like isoform X1 [Panicum virgatum]XP_039837447.1 translation initiation factor IF-2-like isoform X1 [Panicum virgatum]XP_03